MQFNANNSKFIQAMNKAASRTVTHVYRTSLENGKVIKHNADDLTAAREDAKYWSAKHNSAVSQTKLFVTIHS